MTSQPFVTALSICGPINHSQQKPSFLNRRNNAETNVDQILSSKENLEYGKSTSSQQRETTASSKLSHDQLLQDTLDFIPPALPPKYRQQESISPPRPPKSPQHKPPPPSTKIIGKKLVGAVAQKPPFLTGKAPVRNNTNLLKSGAATTTANIDNRAEIADLKKQINELSYLLRQHVDTKGTDQVVEDDDRHREKNTRRDVGTDPIIFGTPSKVDRATNTDSKKLLCLNCKKKLPSSTPSPIESIIEEFPEEEETETSPLDSFAMQYFPDDQSADIIIQPRSNQRSGPIVTRKPISNKKQPQYHQTAEMSPSTRHRMTAMATTTESDTFSPSFGSGGGLTLTRRRCVMTTEHQVSIFDGGYGSNGGGTANGGGNRMESLPFGMSVASQDFMQRHGVLKNPPSARNNGRQTRNVFDPEEQRLPNYFNARPPPRRDNYYRGNNYDSSIVGPPRNNYNHPQQRRDTAQDYYEDEWD